MYLEPKGSGGASQCDAAAAPSVQTLGPGPGCGRALECKWRLDGVVGGEWGGGGGEGLGPRGLAYFVPGPLT